MDIVINLNLAEIEEMINVHLGLKGVNVQSVRFVCQRMYDRMDNDIGVEFTKAEVHASMPSLNRGNYGEM